jgi:hypothetical protein
MSLVFSDTENLNGILQLIEEKLGFDYGFITGNSRRLKQWTAKVNLTHDDLIARAIKAGGTWQMDDSNHEDFPFIRTNLVQNQRDYTFTRDEQGNLVLDIYRVMIAQPNGVFKELNPVDMQTAKSETTGLIDGQNLTGVPNDYDKTGNGILLDRIPNYSYTLGVKVFINREGSYFTTADTDKYPGVDGRVHEYYVVNPCMKYALDKGLKTVKGLQIQNLALEEKIEQIYSVRHRDEPRRMTPAVSSTK